MLGSPSTTVERGAGRVAFDFQTVPRWRRALRGAVLVGVLVATALVVLGPRLEQRTWAARFVPLWAQMVAVEARMDIGLEYLSPRDVQLAEYRWTQLAETVEQDPLMGPGVSEVYSSDDVLSMAPTGHASTVLALAVSGAVGGGAALVFLWIAALLARPARLVLARDWVELDGVRVELADLDALGIDGSQLVAGGLRSRTLRDPVDAGHHLEAAREFLILDGSLEEREARRAARQALDPVLSSAGA